MLPTDNQYGAPNPYLEDLVGSHALNSQVVTLTGLGKTLADDIKVPVIQVLGWCVVNFEGVVVNKVQDLIGADSQEHHRVSHHLLVKGDFVG